ncbi:hypothetical protein DRO38_08040 [Candidatus Bathyarchaeota archaeon]|nr:MAG: hypothetical protein DRO38_08040 [Candidatus Bathyarchaeota archaeon]
MVDILDATLPSDTSSLVSDLGTIGRETRAKVNELISNLTAGLTELTLDSGDTVIASSQLSDASIEVIWLTGDAGSNTIENITGCSEGKQIIIRFVDDNVTIADDNAKIALNSAPYPTDFVAQAGDMLALVNKGGDGSGTDGVWYELWRKLEVGS